MTLVREQHTRPSIAAVLEAHGSDPIHDRTGWRATKCPYHDDSTASAAVNTNEGVFKCHACGVKGDVYSLIQHREGVSFVEALLIGDRLEADPNATSHISSGRSAGAKRGYKPPGRRGRR